MLKCANNGTAYGTVCWSQGRSRHLPCFRVGQCDGFYPLVSCYPGEVVFIYLASPIKTIWSHTFFLGIYGFYPYLNLFQKMRGIRFKKSLCAGYLVRDARPLLPDERWRSSLGHSIGSEGVWSGC